jgi:hypothetical protein
VPDDRSSDDPIGKFSAAKLLMPLDLALELAETEDGKAWIRERIDKGDPGPLFSDGKDMWTEQSDAEEDSEARRVAVRAEAIVESPPAPALLPHKWFGVSWGAPL